MKKPRTQPAFADLTEPEFAQLADWLRHETYEIVLDRIRKPRAEGGFGLTLSRSPLERLYAKVALLDLINARVSEDKKLTLTQLETAWGSARVPRADSGVSPESSNSHTQPDDLPELTTEAHRAIIETTHDLATSGDNTPTQLLTLQRLADFPARAELRARKEERQCERHSWKAEQHSFRAEQHSWKREQQSWRSELHTCKLEMHASKLDQAAHRKHIANERLTLAQNALALRQHLASPPNRNLNLNPNPSPTSPSPESSESERPFRLWTPEEIAINQPKIEAFFQADPFLRHVGLPCDEDETEIPEEIPPPQSRTEI